ncbi:MAG: rod shape-determining protein MreD [Armatimonadota bacterium]|nr:rod shape-determining protein MreD [Armatimonadota bacterium]MDR7409812.1 rod shape-determining protein MreD [Armatimonadota bacterium]MDR7412340.1 rod shape-determining protein MreD [Armatimonadota bacterium]MDR7442806.1 rod shape-determining protein MreD [Armatimonadota bacterium]MDR7591048.1 rod shape-determining protein MreD [Armatimonadota bacterium]
MQRPWRLAARGAGCGALLLGAVVVEGAWGWRLGWMGGAPEPVLVVLLALGLRMQPEGAALLGFLAGLLQDLAGGGALGVFAMSKLWVGFGAGSLARTVVLDSAWAPSAFAVAGTAAARLLEVGLSALAGDPPPSLLAWARGTAVAACYNGLIAPLVFAGLRRVERWRGRLRLATSPELRP